MTGDQTTHFFKSIMEMLAGSFQRVSTSHDMFTIEFETADSLMKAIALLSHHPDTAFTQLTDITAVDYPSRPMRFDMVYHFLSMTHNQRIRLKLPIKDGEVVPSITPLFQAANWYEREVYDLYGILFSNHPDLRRILCDYSFHGHPMRKDFPLSGYYEVRYDDTHKKVIYEPVVFPQAFRQFDNLSPWEGMLDAAVEGYSHATPPTLPGDEKAGGAS